MMPNLPTTFLLPKQVINITWIKFLFNNIKFLLEYSDHLYL